jgi:hypothetical protein
MDFVLYPSLTIYPVETLPSCAPVEVLSECHIEFLRTFLNKVRIICPSLEISKWSSYRDSATRFFASSFFHQSVSPNPLSIPLGPFQIFTKFTEIFAAQGALPVSLTTVANGKNLLSKSVKYLV